MANWISSKLKVAETFLQQIDQQAAESLGKNELPRSPSLPSLSDSRPTKSESAPPLKYQLPKRPPPPPSLSPPPIGSPTQPDPGPDGFLQRKPVSDPAIADDGDWTELLSSPKPIRPVPRPNGASARKASVRNAQPRKSPVPTPASARRSASTENVKIPSGQEPAPAPQDANLNLPSSSISGGLAEAKDGDSAGLEDGLNLPEAEGGKVEGGGLKEDTERGQPGDESSASSSGSDSGSDSSDSEDERRRREERRKRREKLMAEKSAAVAVEAIKEREDVVAKLEGEKQSLEKMLEERGRQQAQEASELQLNMMETMEAVDLEKQKHNSTRMEALTSLAKLETTNAELARELATTQRNLEVEVNRVAELRQQIDSKELALEELRRRMSTNHQATSSREAEFMKRDALEQEILDAEYSLICDKVAKLKDKAKKLQESITTTRVEIEHPSELEIELKMRLTQLTDHLIQKQSQVEALSSEKATLSFRIEAVSRSLNDNGPSLHSTDFVYDSEVDPTSTSISVDVEAGVWQPSNVAPRRAFRERIRSGQQQLGSVVLQLDAIFSAGLVFLKRNPMAQLWALCYLVCLHLWVMYILMSHTKVSDGTGHGAVFSLDTINNTSGS